MHKVGMVTIMLRAVVVAVAVTMVAVVAAVPAEQAAVDPVMY